MNPRSLEIHCDSRDLYESLIDRYEVATPQALVVLVRRPTRPGPLWPRVGWSDQLDPSAAHKQ